MGLRELGLTRGLQFVDSLDRPIRSPAVTASVRAVHLFLVTGNRVLVQITGPDHRRPGLVGSSMAGFVHEGEEPSETLIRRAQEEIGIYASSAELAGVIRTPEDEGFKFSYVYVQQADGTERVVEPGHVESLEARLAVELKRELASHPQHFTPSFPYVFPLLLLYLRGAA